MIRGVNRAGVGGGCCPPPDYRSKPRRRGDTLHEAIYQATLAELTEVGYAELTMDRVAARAKASKGSLYRRWPSRVELVVDTVRHALPEFAEPADTGELRTDLLAVLHQISDTFSGPSGAAARGLISEVIRDPELMRVIRTHLIDPVEPPMFEVLRRGVVRGEVRPAALTPRVARVGTDLLRQQFLTYGRPSDDEVVEIVDEVLIPLVQRQRDDIEPAAT